MAKVQKVYPAFYNGVSQQAPELVLDNQCRDMVNCIPDLIEGISKRPPALYNRYNSTYDLSKAKVIHTYDRGDGVESYIFVYTGLYDTPLAVFDVNGNEKTVTLNSTNATAIKAYMANTIRGLTVQDRTYLVNTAKKVTTTANIPALSSTYDRTAYYWIKQSSGTSDYSYRYAVYLNGTLFQQTGTASDTVISALALAINTAGVFTATAKGSMMSIVKNDGADFTFSYWDSYSEQASFGWKGSVNKLSDLPKDFAFTTAYVEIVGNNTDQFTVYYVKWDEGTWRECRDPKLVGNSFTNLPLYVDRQPDGSFLVNIITLEDREVGNTDNNPDPSFANSYIKDILFFKNRLGLATTDNVVLSRVGDYYNFYSKTALDVLDTDPIDVAIASNKASQIQFVTPFQSSLFIFTNEGQFELTSDGYLSPTKVSIDLTSSYPISPLCSPVPINNSLLFISKSNNRQQLREMIKDENTLTSKAVDLNITTPTYMEDTIVKIVANSTLGVNICCTNTNVVYVYKYADDGANRIQSAWCKWEFFDIPTATFEYDLIGNNLLIIYKHNGKYVYHTLDLTKYLTSSFEDTTIDTTTLEEIVYPYRASMLLPIWYPKRVALGNAKDKMLLKQVKIQGEGQFSFDTYRKDYNYTYTKTHTDSSIKDLDVHINSRVDMCDMLLYDDTESDFKITSIIYDGLYTPRTQEIK